MVGDRTERLLNTEPMDGVQDPLFSLVFAGTVVDSLYHDVLKFLHLYGLQEQHGDTNFKHLLFSVVRADACQKCVLPETVLQDVVDAEVRLFRVFVDPCEVCRQDT